MEKLDKHISIKYISSMKKKKLIRFTLVFLFTQFVIFGGAFIQYFNAVSSGDNIVLTWQTLNEENVKEFVIFRGPDRDHLAQIAVVEAKGDNSEYTYIDENAYKTNESFYAYALIIVDTDGSRSEPIFAFVTHNGVSSVKRTWGSIKALFR